MSLSTSITDSENTETNYGAVCVLRENPGTNKKDYQPNGVPADVEPDKAVDGRSPGALEDDEVKDEHVGSSGDCNTGLIQL